MQEKKARSGLIRGATAVVLSMLSIATLGSCGKDSTGPGSSPPPPPPPPNQQSVVITGGPATVRQGAVVTYQGEVRGADGAPTGEAVAWSLAPVTGGLIQTDGRFVGYTPGTVRVIASAGGVADTLEVLVQARGLSGSFSVVGHGDVTDRFTSDLWLFGNVAYTGTWSCRDRCGNTLFAWDISNPAQPVQTGSVSVDAQVVNDVKVRADGTLAVITHEISNDNMNGITLLDLTNPLQPAVISRFTQNLGFGVHNVWVDGNFVYAVADGTLPAGGSGLQILDISDPANPQVVSSFYAGDQTTPPTFLHDVYVRNGLAFLSHWDVGLIILDVGNGITGGSPQNPVELGRVVPGTTVPGEGLQTHNAWYWPQTGYVFVGEEDFDTPGIMYVIDANDLRNPKQVATFRVPGAISPPHNFWLDEENSILYMAWYTSGIQTLDVSGELLGELERQGRRIASLQYDGSGQCGSGFGTCTWAPQLHNGLVFVSDLHSGIWALRLNP